MSDHPSNGWEQPKQAGWEFRLGTAPTQSQSILRVLLRAIYSHIIIFIQLLLRGGSTEGLGL